MPTLAFWCLFGIVQSHFVLGEPLTPAVLASAACVLTGACLTFWRPASAQAG